MPNPVHDVQGSRPPHLLVVDDDVEISGLIRRYFTAQGFQVSAADSGAAMRGILAAEIVDLILLDLGLPGEDGFDLVRHLHEEWQGPVIIVTGRGDSVDRVVGLELGADDYVTKPFDLRELLARARSVLRRAASARRTAEAGPAEPAFRFAGFCLDPVSRVLTEPQGATVPLTSGEYELLRLFLERPNRVLTRDDMMMQTHRRDAGPYDRAIDVQIGRLRRKIEPDPANPTLIKAVRGVGYMFTERVRRA
ncbi:response regulator [Frateuria defendens]|uniref:response regulator n=1 Tax=Frateuria defendens TaxID=2219559 RepID=UPI00066FE9A8|nr:response regulator transcription factor [Frateuria defendens]